MPRTARSRPIPIAAVSLRAAPLSGDFDGSLAAAERAIALARRRGAKLIVFPEAVLGGYLHEEIVEGTIVRGAPPVLDDPQTAFARLARAAGDAVVCIGYTEGAGAALPYSTVVCLNGDGVLGEQRKVHIPPGELGLIAPGSEFRAFDTPVGRLGMLVCYDKVFPEAARSLALDGAEIIACPAAWPVCRERPARRMRHDRQVHHFNTLDAARAIENQVVWVSANLAGRHGRLRFPAEAKVVDPDGRVLATTGTRAGIAVARIDPAAAVRAARESISHLGDRMAEAYAPPTPAVL